MTETTKVRLRNSIASIDSVYLSSIICSIFPISGDLRDLASGLVDVRFRSPVQPFNVLLST